MTATPDRSIPRGRSWRLGRRARPDAEPSFPDLPPARRVFTVDSCDGTRLCVTVWGDGPRALVLSPGLATPPTVYDYLVERFAPHLRVVTWDMRGSFRSSRPPAGAAAQRVEDSAADLEAVADHLGLDRFVLGGWSMGVQVSLEYAHRHPQRLDGLLLINGGYGHVLDYVFDRPAAGWLVKRLLDLFQRAPRLVDRFTKAALGWSRAIDLLYASGAITANRPFVEDVIRQFRGLDFGYYFQMMARLHAHTAEPYLDEIRVPTLITAGTKDLMTPVSTARTMAARIRDAELLLVPQGTHYTPLEYPDVVADAVERWLRKVYPDALPPEG